MLKDIFTMIKADCYTVDGREEIIKAQEAETEDAKYEIGQISQKTGLQKTANGWVKPKTNAKGNGGNTESKSSESKSNSAKTYIKKNSDGSYAPYISTPQGEHMLPGAHTYSTEKGAQKALEKFSATHNIESNSTQTKISGKIYSNDSAPRILTGDTKIRIRK